MKRNKSNVAARRRQLGLSQYALAKRAGVAQSHIQKIECGEIAFPRVELAMAIAKALEVSVETLFGSAA
jgi:transcriptional regulator with XRE-family HTH domain